MSDKIDLLTKRFYATLPGSKKKTKTIGAEVPIDYDRWLAEVAASPDYPEFKTKSDVVRDCIHLGLTIRTDPDFRDTPELRNIRKGILALQQLEHVANLQATVSELSMQIFATNPNSSEGRKILDYATDFYTSLEDPDLRARLKQALDSFQSRIVI